MTAVSEAGRESADPAPVTLYMRSAAQGQFSIEAYFGRVHEDLVALGVPVQLRVAPAHSRGLLNRLAILRDVARLGRGPLHITGDITFAALAARGPVVITVHDAQVLTRLQGLSRWLVRKLWFAAPAARADVITVNSQETGRRLVETLPWLAEDRVRVVYVSVADDFTPRPKPFPAARPCILQIGTKANKNVPRLIEAITGLDCEFTIVGPMPASLRDHLTSAGITYRSRQGLSTADLVAEYEAADLLAFVSTEEGFGMPIIEAQRVGRPVVTANVSSMPEIGGDGACYVDPFSVQSIREGIRRIIDDAAYRDGLVAAGFANARRFERRAIARAYADIYAELTATTGAASPAARAETDRSTASREPQ